MNLAMRIIGAALVVTTLVGCDMSKIDIAEHVKTSMQKRLDATHNKSQVTEVVVVSIGGNKYKGMATVENNGRAWHIPVDITADGESVVWEANLGYL